MIFRHCLALCRRTTVLIDRGTQLGSGALIDAIGNAVKILIQGTAVRIDTGAMRRIRAVIQGIGHTVAVMVSLDSRLRERAIAA